MKGRRGAAGPGSRAPERPSSGAASKHRRELVESAGTPEARAVRQVGALLWNDLVTLSSNARLRPAVRRAAEVSLAERLPGLAVGERMAIARRAGGGLIPRLLEDPSELVIGALLQNPRLTETRLGPLLSSEKTPPEVLARVARDRRWGGRYGVRVALCRNPATPVATAVELLSSLRKADLRAVIADPRVAPAVRRRAELLSGDSPSSR